MIQALIFDVGGVLLRTEDRQPRRALEERLGLAPGAAEWLFYNDAAGLRAQRGEISAEAHWQAIAARFGMQPADLAPFWGGDRLDTDLVALIRRLKLRYQTAIISNAMSDLHTLLTEKYPIADAFDVITGSAYEGIMKPDPRIYQRTLERLGREPAAAVFIDDAPANVAGARVIGMHAIHYWAGMDLVAALGEIGVDVE
jgi:epoxide hydrolase-like predicted phosphatase